MKYYLTSTIHKKMCGNISLKFLAELLTWLADRYFANENDDYYINKIIQEILSADFGDDENEEENEKCVVLFL